MIDVDVSLGYAGYKESGVFRFENGYVYNYKNTSGTMGVYAGMDVNYFLTKHLALGLGFSFLTATFSDYTLSTYDNIGNTSSQRENLSIDEYWKVSRLSFYLAVSWNM